MNSKKLYFFNLLIKVLPSSRCSTLKAKVLRWCGAKVGNNVELFTPNIQGNFDLEIGDNVFIGHDTFIFGPAGSKITIEKNAKVGSRVVLVTGYHIYSPKYPSVAGPGLHDDILIKEGAAISTNSLITPGKTVGYKSHVAAGAVVTHDVPDMVRVAGVPARVIKDYKNED